MPRKARIDVAGALHHIIVRGIERGVIFEDDVDRDRFIQRLSVILTETATQCYAWALIPNHFHLLLMTGKSPIRVVMQRLLTGYAVSFNKRHNRAGHLFQNRYKSILCQEDPYFLELVRYIHLNPIRAGLVSDMDGLDHFAYCGHASLIGTNRCDWQNTRDALRFFSPRLPTARSRYREFIVKGLTMKHRTDLTGGGLIRSAGGWEKVIANKHNKVFQKSDERILGDDRFVNLVLAAAHEQIEGKAQKVDLAGVEKRVCHLLSCDREDIFTPGKVRDRVLARSLFCYFAVRMAGITQTELCRLLHLSPAALTQSVKRGEALARERGHMLV